MFSLGVDHTDDFEGLLQVPFTRGNFVLWILVNILPTRQRSIHISTDGTHTYQGFLWKLIFGFRYKRQNFSLPRTATHADIHNVSDVYLSAPVKY